MIGDKTMTYEEMNIGHLAEISKMYVESFNAPLWNDKLTAETAYKRLHQMMSCDGFMGLVCFKDGLLSGMILGNTEHYFDCTHFNIKEFCVRLSLRGCGVGTQLLDAFEQHLATVGIGTVYLFTSRTDETEEFYHKRGYSSWNGMVMMGREISANYT